MAELLWWHRVGQRVACVKPLPHPRCWHGDEILPVCGRIYTIRAVSMSPRGNPCLRLEEIKNTRREYGFDFDEVWFRASQFRPVRETSIEQFRVLLNPTPERRNIFEGMPEVEHV